VLLLRAWLTRDKGTRNTVSDQLVIIAINHSYPLILSEGLPPICHRSCYIVKPLIILPNYIEVYCFKRKEYLNRDKISRDYIQRRTQELARPASVTLQCSGLNGVMYP
jgi:hypothetical protein